MSTAAHTEPATRARGDGPVRDRILAAAKQRFARYGFGKTTMAEIAADCGMSAANLYRYFDSKEDIAATGARQWLDALEGSLDAIARDGAAPAGQRLRRIVLAKFDSLRDLIESEPHLEELIEHVCVNREDIVLAHRETLGRLFARVIGDGIASGEFDVDSAGGAAEAFLAAVIGFFHHAEARPAVAARTRAGAERALALLVRGLARR